MMTIALLAALAVSPAQCGWQEDKKDYDDYREKHAAAEELTGTAAAKAWTDLAAHSHCKRLPYVGVWCHQRAAWAYHQAGKRTEAEAEAKVVIEAPVTNPEVKRAQSRAHTILGQPLALKSDTLDQAIEHYQKAVELDPQNETAQKGLASLNAVVDKRSHD